MGRTRKTEARHRNIQLQLWLTQDDDTALAALTQHFRESSVRHCEAADPCRRQSCCPVSAR